MGKLSGKKHFVPFYFLPDILYRNTNYLSRSVIKK